MAPRWLPATLILLAVPVGAVAQPIPAPPPVPVAGPVPPMAPGPYFAPPMPPQVFVHRRVPWPMRRAPVQVYVSPMPPPVWVTPGTPPPPVYMTPPPVEPVYVQPQPYYQSGYQGPCPNACQVPPVVAVAPVVAPIAPPPVADWQHRIGFGVTGTARFTLADGDPERKGGGILGQLRFRVARHLLLELQGGWERSVDAAGFNRDDIPVLFGMMIPFLAPDRILSPYLVLAGGLNFADKKLVDAGPTQIDDERTQAMAQAGLGLELRLGSRFAINADVRAEGRWNLTDTPTAIASTTSIDGKPVKPISDDYGLRANLGATVYF